VLSLVEIGKLRRTIGSVRREDGESKIGGGGGGMRLELEGGGDGRGGFRPKEFMVALIP
jgi:hypothetical protein